MGRGGTKVRRIAIRRDRPWLWGIITAVLAAIVLLPILEMVVVSVEPLYAVENGAWFPNRFEWANYLHAFQIIPLATYGEHSLIVALSSVVVALSISVGVAYVLSRFQFRYRSTLAFAILATQMIPAVTLLLPIYVLYANLQTLTGLHIIGSYPALIAVEASMATPLTIWLLINGLSTIPREMDEAAVVDGATNFSVLWRILLPLALPMLAAAGIFSFLSAWNDLLFASVLTDGATRTLAIGLQEYVSPGGSGGGGVVLWNLLMGGALMSAIPAAAFFLFAQRFLVSGQVLGSVN